MKFDDDFLKDRYDRELARKDKIADSLGLPVTVIIVLGGLTVTMLRGFSYTQFSLTVPFLGLVAFVIAAYARCLWFLAKAYHGPQLYEQLPSLNDLYDAWNKYQAYYDGEDDDRAKEDFEDNLRWRIIQAADQNNASNNSKQGCFHIGITWLFAVILGAIGSAVPFAIDQVLAPTRVPVVHIDNLDQRKETAMPTQTPPTPSQPAATPAPRSQSESKPSGPKPKFPANTVFRNDQPVTTKDARKK